MSLLELIGYFFNVLACGMGYSLMLGLFVVGGMVVVRALVDGGDRMLRDLKIAARANQTSRDGLLSFMRGNRP